MKKVLAFLLMLMCCLMAFSSKLIEVEEVDDFGDPIGDGYLTFDDDLSGTYKNSKGKGKLKWNVIIEKEGYLSVIIKEDAADKDVTISSDSIYYVDESCLFTVSFKLDDNSKIEKYGYLYQSDTYNLNKICVEEVTWLSTYHADLTNLLSSNKQLKIAISTSYGSYSLGSMDLTGVEDFFFDKEPYDEGVKLMNEGKYSEAWDVFAEYKKDDSKSYSYYNAAEKVAECSSQLGRYEVGGLGPAGGYIFYDCDADNNSGNEDGLISSECGWRYLEAAPTDLSEKYAFGYYIPDDAYCYEVGTSDEIGSGKSNTDALVAAMGNETYTTLDGDKGTYAALECENYSTKVGGKIYDDWFLPSWFELYQIYQKLYLKGLGNIGAHAYLSSTENGAGAVWSQLFYWRGESEWQERSYRGSVRPVRAF